LLKAECGYQFTAVKVAVALALAAGIKKPAGVGEQATITAAARCIHRAAIHNIFPGAISI